MRQGKIFFYFKIHNLVEIIRYAKFFKWINVLNIKTLYMVNNNNGTGNDTIEKIGKNGIREKQNH